MIKATEALNREQAFLLYTTFCGDVERTAHALSVRPVDIIAVAEECGWNEKLKNILALKSSGRPGDIERGINRALNFVQAHRFRMYLDRVINRLTDMTPEELESYILVDEVVPGRNGSPNITRNKLSTRALADLASALEKTAAVTYQALGDTATERAKRDDDEGSGDSSGAIHAAIAKAMAEVGQDKSPAALLFDAQTATAVVQATKVDPRPLVQIPYNKD